MSDLCIVGQLSVERLVFGLEGGKFLPGVGGGGGIDRGIALRRLELHGDVGGFAFGIIDAMFAHGRKNKHRE